MIFNNCVFLLFVFVFSMVAYGILSEATVKLEKANANNNIVQAYGSLSIVPVFVGCIAMMRILKLMEKQANG